jgi:hypothetical protein
MTKSIVRLSVLAAAILGLLPAQNATAFPITIDYTGVITNLVDMEPGNIFSAGDGFSGSFTFDSDDVASFNQNYRNLTALTWATSYYSVSLAATSFYSANVVQITDPSAPDLGVIRADAGITGASVPWYGITTLPVYLLLNPTWPSSIQMIMAFENYAGLPGELSGDLTSFTLRESTAVPEPATLILLGTGLVAVIARRRAFASHAA